MGLLDRLTSLLFGTAQTTQQEDPTPAQQSADDDLTYLRPNIGGSSRGLGRVSRDTVESFFSASTNFSIHPPSSPHASWEAYKLDANALSNMSATKLVEVLIDLSPDMSRALWDYLRLCNPGYEITALQPGTDEPHEDAQEALDDFISLLEERHGALDVVFGRLFIGGWLRGAFMAELVLDLDGVEPQDIATPDPASIRFRKKVDEVIGEYWEMGQWQDGDWVSLMDDETIRYVPIDPVPGNPYGRPLVSPALFTTIFLIGLLHDIRRVVSQQGYPRLDLEIDFVRLKETMPPPIAADPKKFRKWVNDTTKEVIEAYANLDPDEAYVHGDAVKVNRPVGAVDSSSLGAIDGLIRGLERQAVRALKTMPILMGSNEATAETHASKQWEIMASGITTLQHYVENMIGRQLELALQAQGILATVNIRFAQLREAERLMNAQTESIEINNAYKRYQYGWITHEQAASEGAGVDEPAEDEPLVGVGGLGGFTEFTTEDGTYRRWEPPSHETALRLIFEGQRIEVEGEAEDIPPVPTAGTLSSLSRLNQETYYNLWNEVMDDAYHDLLRAEPEDDDDDEDTADDAALSDEGEQSRHVYGARQSDTPLWRWDEALKRYRNTETGTIIAHKDMLRLRDTFVERTRGAARSLTARLEAGEVSVREYTVQMREHLRAVHVDQYVMGKGGRGMMTASDWGHTGQTLRREYARFNEFARTIATDEDLSLAQAQVRAEYYVNSSTQSFEMGHTAAYGINPRDLPAQPADGSQQCRMNCRCHWDHDEQEDRVDSYWRLEPGADHCDTCPRNADRWAPYTTYREQRGIEYKEQRSGREKPTQTPNGTKKTATSVPAAP